MLFGLFRRKIQPMKIHLLSLKYPEVCLITFEAILNVMSKHSSGREEACHTFSDVSSQDGLMLITAHLSMKTNGTVVQNNCQSFMYLIDQAVLLRVALEGSQSVFDPFTPDHICAFCSNK